jgi:hypothetical protein
VSMRLAQALAHDHPHVRTRAHPRAPIPQPRSAGKQIATSAEPSLVLSVPLQAGCALVRARRIASAA